MWVTENWIPAAAIFAAIGVVLLFAWSNSGRGLQLLLGIACLAMIGGAYAIDAAVVTESERVELRTRDLIDAFRRKDREAVMGYFGADAIALKAIVVGALELVDVQDDLRVTDIEVKVTGNTATIHFRANATIEVIGHGTAGYQPSRWLLTWEREDGEKGEWHCTEAQRLNPVDGSEMGTLERRT